MFLLSRRKGFFVQDKQKSEPGEGLRDKIESLSVKGQSLLIETEKNNDNRTHNLDNKN